MKSCYFGRKRWYDADEVDKILAELRENNKKAFEMICRELEQTLREVQQAN